MSLPTKRAFPWAKWLAVYGVLSFTMLGLDAGINHRFAFHDNAFTYVPVVFAPLAVVVCAVTVYSRGWQRAAWVLGVLALIVGGVGTFFHWSPALFQHGNTPLLQALMQDRRPILAPAAFASTGLILLLVSWGMNYEARSTDVKT